MMPSAGSPSSTKPLSTLVSIKDLSGHLGITPRALRHYEDLGLVRSDRAFSNTRHYDRETIARLKAITLLRKAGVPIPAVRTILAQRDDPPAYLRAVRETLTGVVERRQRELTALEDLLSGVERIFACPAHDAPVS